MSGGGEKGSATTKTPGDFLKSIRGRPFVVELNSGAWLALCRVTYSYLVTLPCHHHPCILACLDGYMNIAMEQTLVYRKQWYGDAFILRNNVLYISTSKRILANGAFDVYQVI
ncbi:hypothetical protein RGQ29_008429 [Quercus rubra]|uniref:Sm protein F n=1 Tax=Quercus rubra TaxID=3512 RepID=A0AAN7E045_QUERU|nr:hypothetical protein RGQ29_008429 [Quercus rubra]